MAEPDRPQLVMAELEFLPAESINPYGRTDEHVFVRPQTSLSLPMQFITRGNSHPHPRNAHVSNAQWAGVM